MELKTIIDEVLRDPKYYAVVGAVAITMTNYIGELAYAALKDQKKPALLLEEIDKGLSKLYESNNSIAQMYHFIRYQMTCFPTAKAVYRKFAKHEDMHLLF